MKGAFLLTPMRDGKRMFIKVAGDVVKYWLERYPERRKWLHIDGSLYFEIKRYVYGLHEAPHEFNHLLDKTLKSLGFHCNQADPCAYAKQVDEGWIRLSVHVDDILMTCPCTKYRDWFEKKLEDHFPLVKQYDEVSYLGMVISRNSRGDVMVHQSGYLQSLFTKHRCDKLKKVPITPAAVDTFTEYDAQEARCDQKQYLSLIMSLMYAARFTRPDVLMPVSYLATRCQNHTDWHKALRILYYLFGTQSEGLVYRAELNFVPRIYADASHHLHPESHGQQGFFITNGSAPVGHRIKMMTRSSSESELCAAEEAATYAVWYKSLLSDMGIKLVDPIVLFQDNKSTIIMAVQGGSFKRTKHLIGRQSYLKERISSGDLILQYKPTAIMEADLLTKPLSHLVLQRLKFLLHICSLQRSASTPTVAK